MVGVAESDRKMLGQPSGWIGRSRHDVDPGGRRAERFGLETQQELAATLATPHQAGALQDLHVPGDGGEGNAVTRSEDGNRRFPQAESKDQIPADGVSERVEDGSQIGKSKINHMVNLIKFGPSRPAPGNRWGETCGSEA